MIRHLINGVALALLATAAAPAQVETLPASAPLTWEGDMSKRLMQGAHRFVEWQIDQSLRERASHWNRDLTSVEAYERSIEPNRRRFRRAIGLRGEILQAEAGRSGLRAPTKNTESDGAEIESLHRLSDALRFAPRPDRAGFEYYGTERNPALVAETAEFRVYQVRWPVLEGVFGHGLLLKPAGEAKASIIALPDAGQTPEQAIGLEPGIPSRAQFARRLAENGFAVLVPVLIDRTSRWSGSDEFGYTGQPHREWIYRQAFQMGRHIIGYEVETILAAIDALAAENRSSYRSRAARNPESPSAAGSQEFPTANKIGVAGYAEGGLLAFYAAAVDPRIDAALVSGYFDSRQRVWSEPIYRNVWGLLREFGDAEIATLIAPRGLVVEWSEVPQITGQKGDWTTPHFFRSKAEFDRIGSLLSIEPFKLKVTMTPNPDPGPGRTDLDATQSDQPVTLQRRFARSPDGQPGSDAALEAFTELLGFEFEASGGGEELKDRRQSFDPAERQKRQVKQLEIHLQSLVDRSERIREQFFLNRALPESTESRWTTRLDHGTLPAEPFVEAAKPYRRFFREEILGQFDEQLLPPNARTRKIYDRDKWIGYEVVLDVWRDVIAWGVILVPKGIAPGERRPVVVCQHGRRGVPRKVIEGNTPPYFGFAARLAEEGFVTFVPHNLYRGEDRYRWLDRKANSVKASMFSFILAQHQQILNWLGTLDFVDPQRIGFYGLSYGGETAVRVPTLLEGYALSICSGDFNSWTRKVAATDLPFSFPYTIEWEMPYFNMGNTFDYAELAYLMAPRPFMAERGHHDRVSRDHWVAHEYAKVRWLYAQLGLVDRTAMEYFNGGHAIFGQGTFEFLRKHLDWPQIRE